VCASGEKSERGGDGKQREGERIGKSEGWRQGEKRSEKNQ